MKNITKVSSTIFSRIKIAGYSLKNMRIQAKLMFSFILLSIILLLVIGLFSFYSSSGAVINKINTYSLQLAQRIAYEVRNYQAADEDISDQIAYSDDVQKMLPDYQTMDDALRLQFNNRVKETVSSKINTKNGIAKFGYLYSADFEQIKLDNNITAFTDKDFESFRAVAEEAKGNARWILWKGSTGAAYYLVSCREIKSLTDMKVIGYSFIATSEKGFSDIYRDMDLGQGTDIFVVSKTGDIISSRNSKFKVGTAYENQTLISEITQQAKNKRGSFDTNLDGAEYLATYSGIPQSDWYVVCTIPYQYLNSEANKTGWVILVIGACCLVIVIAISVWISGSISKPLKNIAFVMEKAEKGDLTVNAGIYKKDEFGEVSDSFNRMIGSIGTLISKVRYSTGLVSQNTILVSTASDQNLSSSEQIACTIQEVAKGSENQALQALEGVTHMNALSSEINKVGEEVKIFSDNVHASKQLSEDSQRILNTLSIKTRETSNASNKIIYNIDELNTQMKEIKKIVKIIFEISNQTNLLALNAAIEAARAGDAGKGFAVVAEEVRKLANQIKLSTGTIDDIIKNVQSKTEGIVSEANHTGKIVSQQMEVVEDTADAFRTIFNAMVHISDKMNSLDESVHTIIETKEEVLKNIENISAVSEETAAAVEQISASTQEQMSAGEELARAAKSLKEMVEDLDNSISKFEI